MTRPTAEALAASVPLPDAYRYELLYRSEVPALARAVDEWFPGLAVGNASCYLRKDFYADRVFLDGNAHRDFFVLPFNFGDNWAGMSPVERDKDSRDLSGRAGTIAKPYRGVGLSKCFPPLMEAMGKAMGPNPAVNSGTPRARIRPRRGSPVSSSRQPSATTRRGAIHSGVRNVSRNNPHYRRTEVSAYVQPSSQGGRPCVCFRHRPV